jgi:hypothetical protein
LFVSKWGIHTLLLNHGVCGLQGIYFFVSAQIANAGCMCSLIVYFLHCICVCDCDSRHELLIMLSHSVMVRRSHLLARCYLGTMCMCTTLQKLQGIQKRTNIASKNYNNKCLFKKGREAQQITIRRKNPGANPKQGMES